jgi:DNA-binding protein HU-beta
MARKAAAKKATTRKSKKAAPPAVKPVKVTATPGKAITQGALMQVVADRNDITRAEAKRFVEDYIEVVKAHVLKGVKVKLGDLGMVQMRTRPARPARMGRNPATGEPVKIAAKKASKRLAFRQSTVMRDKLS